MTRPGTSTPFFVVGTQRSGTTLLGHMLDSHPELYVVNEFWALYPYLTGETDDLERLAALLATHLELPAPPDAGTPPATALELTSRALAEAARRDGKRRWGIKDPRLTYFLEEFRELYPGARFVLIVRDARGVCASYLAARWNVANVYHGARLWRSELLAQRAFAERHPECCHLLRFEDLVAEPRSELLRVCEFLGERFDEAMLSFHRHRPRSPLHEGNVNITRPLQRDIPEKWRATLSARQIGIIEWVTADLLRAHGYEPLGRGVRTSAPERWFYDLHQTIVTNYRWQRRSRWEGVRRRVRRLLGGR